MIFKQKNSIYEVMDAIQPIVLKKDDEIFFIYFPETNILSFANDHLIDFFQDKEYWRDLVFPKQNTSMKSRLFNWKKEGNVYTLKNFYSNYELLLDLHNDTLSKKFLEEFDCICVKRLMMEF